MKKLFTILLFLMLFKSLPAPGYATLVVTRESAIEPYEKLWKITCFIESTNRPYVIGDNGESYGIAQIQQVRLDDYFEKTGIRYSVADCFNVDVSKKIWLYYASQFDYRDIKSISKDWNKSKTNRYYLKVKNEFDKTN